MNRIPDEQELASAEEVTIGPVEAAEVEALLANRDRLALLGSRLSLTLKEKALVEHGVAVHQAFPDARLHAAAEQLYPIVQTKLSREPTCAPKNYRALPPLEGGRSTSCEEGCCYMGKYVGSGVPLAQADKVIPCRIPLTHCLGCASADTRVIWVSYSAVYSRRHGDVSILVRVEFECKACGQFSSWTIDED